MQPTSKTTKSLKQLLEHLVQLQDDCMDDREDILAELATNGEYVVALFVALEVFRLLGEVFALET